MLYSTTGSLASTIGEINPLRYRGYYYDTETSLYYLQSRYYDPESCRFISADAYIVAGDYLTGINMFAYCLNNPVMYSDPSGEEPEFLSLGVAVIIGTGMLASALLQYLSLELALDFAKGISTNLSIEDYLIVITTVISNLSSASAELLQGTKLFGAPNSEEWVSKNTLRKYDSTGKAYKDVDYKNNHPEIGTPHDHDWTWGKNGPSRGGPKKHTESSLNQSLVGIGLVAVCAVGFVFVAANDLTGIGAGDDVLFAPLLGGIYKGLEMI